MANSILFIGRHLVAMVVLYEASLSISQSAVETANPLLVSIFLLADVLLDVHLCYPQNIYSTSVVHIHGFSCMPRVDY